MNICLISLPDAVFNHGLIQELPHKGNIIRIFPEKRKVYVFRKHLPQKNNQIEGNSLVHLLFIFRIIFHAGKLTHKRNLLLPLRCPK